MTELTQLLVNTYKSQIPHNFYIYQLPQEDTSWIVSILERSTATTGLRNQRGESKPGISINGTNSSKHVEFRTPFSNASQHGNAVRSSVLSRTKSDIIDLAQQLRIPFEAPQLKPPSQMWRRPSASTITPTPQSTSQDEEISPFNANCADTQTPIPTPKNKHVFPRQSSSTSNPEPHLTSTNR